MREIGIAGPVFVSRVANCGGIPWREPRKSLDAAGIKSRFIEIDDSEIGQNHRPGRTTALRAERCRRHARRRRRRARRRRHRRPGRIRCRDIHARRRVRAGAHHAARAGGRQYRRQGGREPSARQESVGTIHQPHLVLSDPDTLATLPPRASSPSGMAEVVKTAIIGSPALFEQLRVARGARARRRAIPPLLDACVRAVCRIKGRIVEADPFERDQRRVLNLGHTLGHAVEAVAGYGTFTHGEAVSIGLVAAARWR